MERRPGLHWRRLPAQNLGPIESPWDHGSSGEITMGNEEKEVKPAEKQKPSYHIYSRQRDQHVVGEGCWCMPRVEVVNGERVVIHKRD